MLNGIPLKRSLKELSISYKALIIGVIGGYVGTLIGLPLPWLLGALGLNLCFAFTNYKIDFSKFKELLKYIKNVGVAAFEFSLFSF